MTTSLRNPITSYRWKINYFQKEWLDSQAENQAMYSDMIGLVSRPNVNFYLRFNTNKNTWLDCWYGAEFETPNGDQFISIQLKVWFENQSGQKFGERSIEKSFSNQSTSYRWGWTKIDNDAANSLENAYQNFETFYICCEITDFIQEIEANFNSNQWALFEEGVHDSIINLSNGVEFKIMKAFVISQSPVFKRMFQSSFIEGQTNTVKIDDIDESTMKALIKWFYTGQIENDVSIEKLFEASDKYDISLLKKICVYRLLAGLSKENSLSCLLIGLMHNHDQLKKAALNQIVKMSISEVAKMLLSKEWIQLNREDANVADEVNKLISEKLIK